MLHLSLLPFVLFAEHMSLAQLPCHLTAPQEEMALPVLRAINGPDGCSPSLSYSLFPSFLFLFYFLFLFSQPTPTFFSLDMNPSFKHSLIFFFEIWPNLQCHSNIILLALWGLTRLLNMFTEKVWHRVSVRVCIKIKRVVCMRGMLPDKHCVNTAKLELQSCFQ